MKVQNSVIISTATLSASFKRTLEDRYGPGINNKFRDYEKTKIKITKEETHIKFLRNVRDNQIIPDGFRVKSPIPGTRALKILERASFALIRSQINYHRWKKTTLIQEATQKFEEIKEFTLEEDHAPIFRKIDATCEKIRRLHQQTHDKKWAKLIRSQQKAPNTHKEPRRTIVNISSHPLSSTETTLLEKGLNFAVTPTDIPVLDIICAVETTRLEPTQAEEFKWKVRSVLDKVRKPHRNISKQEDKALKSLRKNKSIKILPADKGNTTVIMDSTTYDQKIEEVLQQGNYRKLNKDPTTSLERKVYHILKSYETFLTPRMKTRLTPHHSKPPHLYGLPKIHKNNMPLRPITSSRNGPTYQLAKFLLPIVQPLQDNSPSQVKDTKHFVDILSTVELQPRDQLVSFDVESLYTNVPVEEALEIIRKKLQEDENLNERTTIPVEGIMKLLECCLKNSYFQENDRFFAQDEGLPMGSSLSPIVANIYMNWFETHAIEKAKFKPKLWLRYVDDTFIVWNHSSRQLDHFLLHLNNIKPSIKFTMEKENEDSLPFLDVHVKKNNGMIVTTVYRKPTHTGQYLNYASNHSTTTKKGVAKSLIDRAYRLCNSEEGLQEEMKKIKRDLQQNGYPGKIIDELTSKRQTISNQQPEKEEQPKPRLSIPYVKGLSEKIKRVGRKYKIDTVFKSSATIRSMISNTRPQTHRDSKNCVYQVPCECGQSYVGETKRPLEVRLKEHRVHTQRGETSRSGIAQHSWEEKHRMKWSEAKIIHREEHWHKRKFIEAAVINNNRDVFSQPSVDISNIWKPLIGQLNNIKLN